MTDHTRPLLALRIGVTGTRAIGEHQEAPVRAAVAAMLRTVQSRVAELAKTEAAAAFYISGRSGVPVPSYQMISPLAEGADRLAADEASKLDFALVAPLPFPSAEYEKDFSEDKDTYRALLDRSTVIELDGARGEAEAASYEAVGRFVVQNSDLIVAIWDGHTTGKRGGTAEITRFAAEIGVPVWWIDVAGERAPMWIGDVTQWDDRETLSPNVAMDHLDTYLAALVLPPPLEEEEPENIVGHAGHQLQRFGKSGSEPRPPFLAAMDIGSSGSPLWKTHATFYKLIAPRQALADPVEVREPPIDEAYWRSLFDRADLTSVAYADRYRSSYLLIIFSAFLIAVVSVGSTQLPVHLGLPSTILELLLLVAIAALAIRNHAGAWHDHWINLRLMAELCRGQAILLPIGARLPRPDIIRNAAVEITPSSEPFSKEAWVAWFIEAAARAAPWPKRNCIEAKQEAQKHGSYVAQSQAAYHQQRSARTALADSRLGNYGERCFFLTLALVLVRFILFLVLAEPGKLGEGAEGVATLLSAASASFVAIRFYSEFGLLDRQSRRMRENIEECDKKIRAIKIEQPLSSLDLGKALQQLSASMLLETAGWAELFRIRSVETG